MIQFKKKLRALLREKTLNCVNTNQPNNINQIKSTTEKAQKSEFKW